jgi:hypothetical protein
MGSITPETGAGQVVARQCRVENSVIFSGIKYRIAILFISLHYLNFCDILKSQVQTAV